MRYFPTLRGLIKQPELYVVEAAKRAEPTIEDTDRQEVEQVKSSISVVAASKKIRKPKPKSDTNKSEEKKMSEEVKQEMHDHHDHEDKECLCCPKVEVPVVGKFFDFCDEKKYRLEKFEEYIQEYYELYPYVLIKYKRIDDKYKYKCNVRFCVYFALLDYEKAWEIEQSLQKKYRHIKLHH